MSGNALIVHVLARAEAAGVQVMSVERSGGTELLFRSKAGEPAPDLLRELQAHWDDLIAYLGTRCHRCGAARRRLVVAYWGPRLCPPCAQRAAAELDAHQDWPPVAWDEVELQRIGG